MDRAQSKEVYGLLHKSVEDASYNFDDPDRDDHSKLQDISDRIFKTADAHKHMVSRKACRVARVVSFCFLLLALRCIEACLCSVNHLLI